MFLKNPFIPNKKIALVAVSADNSEIINALEDMNIKTLKIEKNENLDSPIQSHPDMQLLKLRDNNILICKELEYLKSDLIKYGFEVVTIDEKLEKKYPNDILLNNVIINDYCIAKIKSMPQKLIDYCETNSINLVNIKQGYSKCSTAILNNKCIVTSDKNISLSYKALGFKVLYIPYGDIDLPGYDYGFIGGCCGLIDKNKLAFTGTLDKYKYGKELKIFLYNNEIEPVYLTNNRLLDIGSIIPLKY